ncbi:oxidoreductase [Mesorhizobium sp. DCY119]|nr:oxidoreductase [Mesorhizobium sp. DCY119]
MISVRVAKKSSETEDIASFELVPVEGTLPEFTAGAHVDVHLPSGLIRQYSLLNAPNEVAGYRIAVLQETAGRGGSLEMHRKVHQGDCLAISAPRNAFRLADNADSSVLIAGGIGITPMLAMTEELWRRKTDFVLHYLSRSRGRAAFLALLEDRPFASSIHFSFDDEATSPIDLASLIGPSAPRRHLYVCGPSGMINAVRSRAVQTGWDEAVVHSEQFTPVAPVLRPEQQGFEVVIRSKSASYFIPPDKTIAQVLKENGMRIPTSCEQGICGTCLTRVIEGIPEHRDQLLTDEERAMNQEMTICCSRALSPRLVLDL